MCGISGKYAYRSMAPVSERLIRSMAKTMSYRGPDEEGFYVKGPIGFGHNRLSIIDLNTGRQPLSNEDETVWIVFNGEIYNYRELRKELIKLGHKFRTESDTEVIVHLYEEHGEKCIDLLRGMFAFAIWDDKNRVFFLARDRVGIKPLYYAFTEDGVVFASEIKALLKDPSVDREIDLQMIDRFLTYYYLPGDRTLFKDIKKLLPGHYMKLSASKVQTCQYWDLDFRGEYGGSLRDAEKELKEIIRDSVACHMISDVPVGFLLSGGVDSTALLSFASENTDREVSSFTIGFEDEDFPDERPYARLAADTFGSRHYETTISARQFQDFLPDYVLHMEEPVCEPPAIALYYVAQLAKEHVKVLISGEGGDEAFAGYPNYRKLIWVERLKKLSPSRLLSCGMLKAAAKLTGSSKFESLIPYLDVNFEEYYLSRTSTPFGTFNNNPHALYNPDFIDDLDKNGSYRVAGNLIRSNKDLSLLSKMLYVDSKTWLPDDLLIKADRMTMANSLELRVPLLDHKVLEFAAALPDNFKVKGFSLKHILKQAVSGVVPNEILARKKAGFPIPYSKWLSQDMNEFVKDSLLSEAALARGIFDKSAIESLLTENAKTRGYSKEIFSLLVLELWQNIFSDSGRI